MNWYIAIASLISGFCLGLVCSKWKDIGLIKDFQSEFLKVFIENNRARNEQLKELFNTQRKILLALVEKQDESSVD